ncbi:hypothetical protein J421_3033 [Gemmatirosa kalamazoonensis]|uniref:Uncharacterized protein n=1 Tax=Gemmatirosa kalamazoonensis TaxID=861299 RepID=W0RJQ3_9BACT|nr:hypothetical protein [Gemmatirosa kalamazoonensis]AHG90570.1 hypothetical protein J421_3033 [Gemmatirosa kalamazoonensis]
MSTIAAPERVGEPLGAPAAAPPAAPIVEQRIPTEVSAAWELELLIAGAVTFALFQLPGSIDALREQLMPKATGGWLMAVLLGYLYTKVIVYTLIAAFLLNLTLRAYWVGLVGLHSVFPRGVDWERMQSRAGPATIEEYRRRHSSIPSIIARVDNFASVIFSFAFLVVVTCLFSLVGSALFGGVAWAINQLVFGGRHGLLVFELLAFGFAVPLVAIGVVDKKYGRRWAPDSVAGRRLRRAARVAMRVNGSSLLGPIMFTLYTNVRKGLLMATFYATFVGALLIAIVELFVRLGAFAGGAPRYVPDDEAIRGVDADHYESMRGAASNPGAITIQSDVIQDPYVRLFIPYSTDRHDPALAASCPQAAPLRPGHLHFAIAPSGKQRDVVERNATAVLACLSRMHTVTLDGAPQDVALRFYTQPATGRRGMIAYLPTATLASGPHTLAVMPAPRAPDSRNATPLRPIEIPFWK